MQNPESSPRLQSPEAIQTRIDELKAHIEQQFQRYERNEIQFVEMLNIYNHAHLEIACYQNRMELNGTSPLPPSKGE